MKGRNERKKERKTKMKKEGWVEGMKDLVNVNTRICKVCLLKILKHGLKHVINLKPYVEN